MPHPQTVTVHMARRDSVEIAYEVDDPVDGEPLLLVMGLGLQMLFWPDTFRRLLAERGFRVARFDNRDVGLSTHLDELGTPSALSLLTRRWSGYRVPDMADDAIAVLDALGWASAHVVGVSLGGMIAQTVAGRHPTRVRSLTSISSTPAPSVGRPHPRALRALLRRPAGDREQAARHVVEAFRVIGSPGYPRDEQWLSDAARSSFDRAHDPAGGRRQLAAIMTSGDRRSLLGGVVAPTLVVHGDADPLVRPSGGRATAAAVPGARLVVHRGMGHDLPGELQPSIAADIASVAHRWRSTSRRP